MKEEPHKHVSSEAQHDLQVKEIRGNIKRLYNEYLNYKNLDNLTMKIAIAKKIKQAESQLTQKERERPIIDREVDDFTNQWESTDAWRNN